MGWSARPRGRPTDRLLAACMVAMAAAGCEDEPAPTGAEDLGCTELELESGGGDPLFRAALRGDEPCPRTFAALVERLADNDARDCRGGPRVGWVSHPVSRRAQLLDRAEDIDVVVSRQCSGRDGDELLLHLQGADPSASELAPRRIDAMAFDLGRHAYNFFSLEDGEWAYHGDSWTVREREGGCGGCHVDGGLLMPEPESPWLHFGAERPLPGVSAWVDRFAPLGVLAHPADLEARIAAGNRRWYAELGLRASDPEDDAFHGGSWAEMLRPLFCGGVYNLRSAGRPDGTDAGREVSELPATVFVDPLWGEVESVPVTPSAYRAALRRAGSHVDGIVGAQDTYFGMTHVVRGAAERDVVDTWIRRGVLDLEFVLDVLAIDATRPLFSEARCDLLAFAPDVGEAPDAVPIAPPDDGDCCRPRSEPGCAAESVRACVCDEDAFCCASSWDQSCVNRAIGCGACSAATTGATVDGRSTFALVDDLRAGFLDRLRAAEPAPGSPAAQLKAHLEAPGQADAHRAATIRFVRACRDRARVRDESAFLDDVLAVAALRKRRAAERVHWVDLPGMVAREDVQPPASAHLDPSTCELRTGG